MTARFALLYAAAVVVGASAPVATNAQVARFDTALVRSTTVGQLLDAARAGDSLARIASWNTALHANFQARLAHLDRPDIRRLGVDVVAYPRAAIGVVARKRRPVAFTEADVEALDSLAAMMQRVLPRTLRDSGQLSAEAINQIMFPRQAYVFSRRQWSIAQSVEKLQRFERKYGPGTPKLNAVEVLLNFGAQWLPAFQPNEEGWPSRLEVVASYVPTYLTIADDKARAVSVGELGIRTYVWRDGWGGRIGGVLRPGYLSFGLAVAGASDGALTSPLQGTSRFGGFFGWGDAKVAVIGGKSPRLLITRQVQLVPWVF